MKKLHALYNKPIYHANEKNLIQRKDTSATPRSRRINKNWWKI